MTPTTKGDFMKLPTFTLLVEMPGTKGGPLESHTIPLTFAGLCGMVGVFQVITGGWNLLSGRTTPLGTVVSGGLFLLCSMVITAVKGGLGTSRRRRAMHDAGL